MHILKFLKSRRGHSAKLDSINSRLEGLEKEAAYLSHNLKTAAAGYRRLLLQLNPEVLPELLRGETVEEIDSSLLQARELVEKVKKGLSEKAQEIQVPAGTSRRSEIDPDTLSSSEKIKEGISRRG